jgi:hypothetical protein
MRVQTSLIKPSSNAAQSQPIKILASNKAPVFKRCMLWLVGTNFKDKIRIICSGKVATGFDTIDKFCLGADQSFVTDWANASAERF